LMTGKEKWFGRGPDGKRKGERDKCDKGFEC
jgi:hypothetical protein